MRRKQLWAGMLAAVLCIGSLAGCGGNKDDAGNGDTGTVEQTEAKSDDGEDAEAEEADSGDKKVVLWTWGSGQFDLVQERYFETHPDADWEFEEVVVPAEDYLTKLQQVMRQAEICRIF